MSDYNYYKNNQNNSSDDDDEMVSDIPTFSVPIKSKDTSSETVSKDEDK